MKIADIATANIEVYEKLKNSTNEIGIFAQYLQNANNYLVNIQALTQKLDDYERRTQIIESAGIFFTKNEKWLAENFDIANLEISAALERFKETSNTNLAKVQESLNGQILNLDNVMRIQQERLKEALTITTEIVTESFINTHQTFEKAISEQQKSLNSKLRKQQNWSKNLRILLLLKKE
ncbi:MAG: hypothetical protein IPP15_16080 [Saprospiraceae bacterium]|uniref:Uncharacterized protein n=1 Tax=Candidatus Opimibacter skivensis TaxID=2982028 RepID=A0A9D7XRA7_9BACT|nr:hypothetical protein [Candidatus Opimibacter skivensis]